MTLTESRKALVSTLLTSTGHSCSHTKPAWGRFFHDRVVEKRRKALSLLRSRIRVRLEWSGSDRRPFPLVARPARREPVEIQAPVDFCTEAARVQTAVR